MIWDHLKTGPPLAAMREGEEALKEVNDEIKQLTTYYLLEVAERYQIVWPEEPVDDEDWSSVRLGLREFSQATIERLRADIRKERKERWEHWQTRLSLLI